jgi:two-component system chemotaxis response regulator CheV
MPVMDGYVLTRNIKEDKRFNGIPVMMHSSLSADENIRLGIKVGADGYMPKLRPTEFIARLVTLTNEAASKAA